MGIYTGVLNKAEKARIIYFGDTNGKAKKIKSVYVGDSNGKARQVYQAPTAVLPIAYQQVLYIRSTTNAEYIDTGIIGTVNNATSCLMKMKACLNVIETATMFGTRQNSNDTRINFGYSGADNQFNIGLNTQHKGGSAATAGQVYSFEAYWAYASYYLIQDGATIVSGTGTFNRSTGKNYYIFRNNYTSPYNARMDLYSCKIYINGALQRDFYPCYRKEDNVTGLYDLKNNVFYRNAKSNTQNFVAGSDWEGEL